jgi:hypothetical protein
MNKRAKTAHRLRDTALYRRIRTLGATSAAIPATADELREAWRCVRERSVRYFYDPPRTQFVRLFNRTIVRADPADGRPWTVGEADDLIERAPRLLAKLEEAEVEVSASEEDLEREDLCVEARIPVEETNRPYPKDEGEE